MAAKRTMRILIMAVCLSIPLYTLAQPGGDDDVIDVPIDGGISLLLVAGASYGVKKLCYK